MRSGPLGLGHVARAFAERSQRINYNSARVRGARASELKLQLKLAVGWLSASYPKPIADGSFILSGYRCSQPILQNFLSLPLAKGEINRGCGRLRFFCFRRLLSATRRRPPLAPQGPAWRITGRKTLRQCLVDQLFFRKFFIRRIIAHDWLPFLTNAPSRIPSFAVTSFPATANYSLNAVAPWEACAADAIHTLLMFMNSRIPYSESSRP